MATVTKPFPLRALIQLLLVVFAAPFIPMIVSGAWSWTEAWLYAIASILAFALSRLLVQRRHPDLIAERARFIQAQDTKPWDKVLAPLLGIGPVLILVAAGLDRYYSWSRAFPPALKAAAFAMILLGYGFSAWALVENRFFSGTVRIQTDRGHRVVSTGPYRIVRHPGYAGGLMGYLFIPVLLDSAWAFLPALLLAVVMVLRTSLEDRTLQAELPGYREFAARTRYRLLPGVW